MVNLKKAKILILFTSLFITSISGTSYELYVSKRGARAAQYDDMEQPRRKRKIPPSYKYDPSHSNSNSNSGLAGNSNSVNPLVSNSYQHVHPQNQYPSANAISNPLNPPFQSLLNDNQPNMLGFVPEPSAY
eukprot:987897_1